MGKVILLVRASTIQQTVEAQTAELIKMAKADGYTDADIYPPIENKESGYQLSEEERLGLNRMKELIESDSEIECIYAWSVSRIGRNDTVNSSIKNYLVKKKIQLKTKADNVVLLNEDGTLNKNAELTFNIFSTLAKQGAEDIKAQTLRGKNQKMREGKSAHGKILYGYHKDKNGKIKEYEPESKWIRYIFNEYVYNDVAVVNLYRELSDKGIFKEYTTERNGISRIRDILKNPSYYGGVHLKKKLKKKVNGEWIEKERDLTEAKQYPAIITKELFDAAGIRLKERITKPKVNTKYVYYAKGLIRFMGLEKPHRMVANRNSITYRLPDNIHRFSVSINTIDSILWNAAIHLYTQMLTRNNEDDREELIKLYKDNELKINTALIRIKEFEDEDERAYQMYLKKKRKAELYEKDHDEYEANIARQNEKILKLKEENSRIEKQLNGIGFDKWKTVDASTIESINDDHRRKEIIDKVIDSIDIYPNEDGTYEIKIEQNVNLLGYAHTYTYKSRGGRITLLKHTHKLSTDEIVTEDVSINIEKRFVRNDAKGDRHKDRKKKVVVAPYTILDD